MHGLIRAQTVSRSSSSARGALSLPNCTEFQRARQTCMSTSARRASFQQGYRQDIEVAQTAAKSMTMMRSRKRQLKSVARSAKSFRFEPVKSPVELARSVVEPAKSLH